MKHSMQRWICVAAAVCAAWPALADDVSELKQQIKSLEKKVDALEKAPAVVQVTAIQVSDAAISEILARDAVNDNQEAAARVDNAVADPKYPGFFPIPGSDVIMKFNAKPHVDFTLDSDESGDNQRFVPAKIPVEGDPLEGGGGEFNANANASQLRWDVRAPDAPGSPRFYYQNDFFGQSGSDMRYRLQHLYGSIYNVVAGFTYGVFEDPDIWPDTVDYEGPNAFNFARRAVAQYKIALNDHWRLTGGVEKPDVYLDTTGVESASLQTKLPDVGANLRWEDAERGHMQLSGIAREISYNSEGEGEDSVPGWGFNLGAAINITANNTVLALGNYGEGIGGMGNDSSFVNSDAAIKADGNLEALEYMSVMAAFTHRWNDTWRSTATYGYVELDNIEEQPGDAYHNTTYASANLVWQLRERLSIGLEGLYGEKETKDGSKGDVFRTQVGMVYSLF